MQRLAAEQGNAVIGFLPKKRGVVAGGQQRLDRKMLVTEFEFLQTQHIDRVGGQPVQHLRQAYFEGVDVPGGDLHGR